MKLRALARTFLGLALASGAALSAQTAGQTTFQVMLTVTIAAGSTILTPANISSLAIQQYADPARGDRTADPNLLTLVVSSIVPDDLTTTLRQATRQGGSVKATVQLHTPRDDGRVLSDALLLTGMVLVDSDPLLPDCRDWTSLRGYSTDRLKFTYATCTAGRIGPAGPTQ